MIMEQKKDVVMRYHYVIISLIPIFAISDFSPTSEMKNVYAKAKKKNIFAEMMTWENCLITS